MKVISSELSRCSHRSSSQTNNSSYSRIKKGLKVVSKDKFYSMPKQTNRTNQSSQLSQKFGTQANFSYGFSQNHSTRNSSNIHFGNNSLIKNNGFVKSNGFIKNNGLINPALDFNGKISFRYTNNPTNSLIQVNQQNESIPLIPAVNSTNYRPNRFNLGNKDLILQKQLQTLNNIIISKDSSQYQNKILAMSPVHYKIIQNLISDKFQSNKITSQNQSIQHNNYLSVNRCLIDSNVNKIIQVTYQDQRQKSYKKFRQSLSKTSFKQVQRQIPHQNIYQNKIQNSPYLGLLQVQAKQQQIINNNQFSQRKSNKIQTIKQIHQLPIKSLQSIPEIHQFNINHENQQHKHTNDEVNILVNGNKIQNVLMQYIQNQIQNKPNDLKKSLNNIKISPNSIDKSTNDIKQSANDMKQSPRSNKIENVNGYQTEKVNDYQTENVNAYQTEKVNEIKKQINKSRRQISPHANKIQSKRAKRQQKKSVIQNLQNMAPLGESIQPVIQNIELITQKSLSVVCVEQKSQNKATKRRSHHRFKQIQKRLSQIIQICDRNI